MREFLMSVRRPTRDNVAGVGSLLGLFGGAWLASVALESGARYWVEMIGIVAVGVIVAVFVQVSISGPPRHR